MSGPGGIAVNSPAIHRRVEPADGAKFRRNGCDNFPAVSTRLQFFGLLFPALKRGAIINLSLRDTRFMSDEEI
jgi:hypothetical protein